MKRSLHKRRSNRNKAQRASTQRMFFNRIRIICEKMVGPGYFELIPKRLLHTMLEKRYPPLRITRATPKELSEQDARAFKRQVIELMQEQEVETLIGEKISFSWYLRDVLLLIHAIQLGVNGGFAGASELLTAFKPYFRKGEWYEYYSQKALGQFAIAGVCGFSFYRGILVGNLEFMPFSDPDTPNVLSLSRLRLKVASLKIEGNYRPLVHLAVYSRAEGLKLLWLSPETLGFEGEGMANPHPLLVQQHVFSRFEERTSLPAGFVHALLVHMITEKEYDCVPKKDKVLWACHIESNKIGYFLLSVFQQCLVVRTFLLLTNIGTPEGNKLTKMTHMQLLDSKYLGVDRLSTFLEYDIGGDPALRTLFTDAGCGSILRYADEMQPIMNEPLKSAAHIHRYLTATRKAGIMNKI